jgi:hypothetical protein
MTDSTKHPHLVHPSPAVNVNGSGTYDVINKELYGDLKKFHVEFKRFYGSEPVHVDREFVITLSDLSYLPKVPYFHPFHLLLCLFNQISDG